MYMNLLENNFLFSCPMQNINEIENLEILKFKMVIFRYMFTF